MRMVSFYLPSSLHTHLGPSHIYVGSQCTCTVKSAGVHVGCAVFEFYMNSICFNTPALLIVWHMHIVCTVV